MKILKLFSILAGLFIALVSGKAQETGIIYGKVIEAESGFTIIGASVFISELGIGTVSDLDGNFKLREVPAGIYNVECTYLGYAKAKVENVSVSPTEVVKLEYSLKKEALTLEEEVVIEARQVRNTEISLLTIKRQSAAVLDGVSAAQIKKTGDRDAAAAVRRVTGVTVEGGKYVYVRGLGDRYSKTTLNGAEVPGLDPNRNTVQMDLFPSNLLDNILVYKSFIPELYGDFTGGYIDIETKDFPEKFTLTASVSLSYNTVNTFNPNINAYQGGSLDWLGFDDGSRALPQAVSDVDEFPSFVPGNSANFDPAEGQQLVDITRAFPNNWKFDPKARPFNHNLSLSMGGQSKIFNKSFGFVAALTYQRNFTGYTDGAYGIFELGGEAATTDRLTTQLRLRENVGVDDVLWGAMASGSMKLDPNNKIGVTFLRNQSATSTARYSEGAKPRDDPDDIFITQSWRFLERSLSTYQIRGKHVIPNWNNFEVKWQSAYSVSTQDDPDLRYFTYRILPDTSLDIKTSDNPPNRFYRNMQQGNWTNRLDLSLPFKQWNELTAKLKVGSAYVIKNRAFREDRYVFRERGVVPFSGVEDYFSDTSLIGFDVETTNWAGGNTGNGVAAEPGVDLRNSYDATQNVLGVYAMVDMPLLKKLRLIAGLRMEQTAVSMRSLDPLLRDSFGLDGVNKLLDNIDFLPAVSLNYELSDRIKLRTAYSRTLARPTFRELAPYTNFDVDGGYLLAGNPNLQRTLTDNLDLRIEFYPTFAELISLGGFFKSFDAPIERTFNPTAPNSEITFRNVEGATLYGAEFELRKNLDFISPKLTNFSLAGNVSYIVSRTNIDSLELNEIRAFDPDASSFREMFGQSPYSLNILLAYQNEKGTSANLSFNVIGPRISIIVRGGTPNVYERPVPRLNFNFTQDFAKDFTFTFRARNLLNGAYRETLIYRDREYPVITNPIGMSFSVGVSYQFKGKGKGA